MRLRPFLWLIALAVFVVPMMGAPAMRGATAHAASGKSGAHSHHLVDTAQGECPDHPPPPPIDCPAHGSAKHAAGLCCPMMAGAVALLAPGLAPPAAPRFVSPGTGVARPLVSHLPTKDPPPPRV